MSSLAFPGGPGPVCPDLPPALRLHAIAASAPPRERARSLLMASTIYLALAGGGILLSRTKAVLPPTLIRTVPPSPLVNVILNPVLPRPAGAAAATGPVSPLMAEPVRALPRDFDPPALPTDLPTGDISHLQPEGAASGALPVGVVPPSGSGSVEASQARAVALEVSALDILRKVDPAYPPMARAAHLQGTVVLQMTIDARGVPTEVQVLAGPPAFREEALRAARQWRFEPARVNGQAVPASFRLTLNFRLR